jgi:Calcium binding
MEFVVDAYDEDERAMGWYYYLEEKLQFPFRAKCLSQREVSPLESGEEVEVVRMPSEDECMNEMFVAIQWGKRTLAIPLAQLEGVEVDDQTKEAIEDWHYWVEQEYEF